MRAQQWGTYTYGLVFFSSCVSFSLLIFNVFLFYYYFICQTSIATKEREKTKNIPCFVLEMNFINFVSETSFYIDRVFFFFLLICFYFTLLSLTLECMCHLWLWLSRFLAYNHVLAYSYCGKCVLCEYS